METDTSGSSNISAEMSTDVQPVVSTAVRLPHFWTANPEIWFRQVEAQFAINKVRSDRLKYDHIIATLPLETISMIFDVIENPPTTDLYQNLKDKLTQRLTASEEQRLDSLLSGSEMGNRKPSEFFRDMSLTVGGSAVVSSELLLRLWKRKLPRTILVALTASDKSQLNDILDLADRIWDTYRGHDGTASTTFGVASLGTSNSLAHPSGSPETSKLLQCFQEMTTKCKETLNVMVAKTTVLESQVHSLQTQIDAIQNSYFSRSSFSRRPRYGRSRSRDKSASHNGKTVNKICFYHAKFGEKALKCQGTWCQYLSQRQSN